MFITILKLHDAGTPYNADKDVRITYSGIEKTINVVF